MTKMMLISVWVDDKSELDFMKRHMDEKGIAWEIRRNPRTGQYGFYREYKEVGMNRLPEPLPSREAWEERI